MQPARSVAEIRLGQQDLRRALLWWPDLIAGRGRSSLHPIAKHLPGRARSCPAKATARSPCADHRHPQQRATARHCPRCSGAGRTTPGVHLTEAQLLSGSGQQPAAITIGSRPVSIPAGMVPLSWPGAAEDGGLDAMRERVFKPWGCGTRGWTPPARPRPTSAPASPHRRDHRANLASVGMLRMPLDDSSAGYAVPCWRPAAPGPGPAQCSSQSPTALA